MYYLGTRTFHYDTDYTFDYKISWEVAKHLVMNEGVNELYDYVRRRVDEEKKQIRQNYLEAVLAHSNRQPLRCDDCGRFIALEDFNQGAIRRLITPDSHYSRETYITKCLKHS